MLESPGVCSRIGKLFSQIEALAKLKGDVRSKAKIWYVVENVVKPHELKYFCSYLRTFPDIPSCFSSESSSC